MPKRTNLKGPGKCIFCGRGGLSKEHIWSEWTYKLVPTVPDGEHIRSVYQSSKHNPRIAGLESKRKRQGSTNTIKIYAVCKTHCNNGWMSRLDETIKPILSPLILGQPSVLSEYNLKLISAWITMKMMVTEFSRPHEVCSTQGERTFLMEHLEPPPNWKIWIAHVQGERWQAAYHRNSSLIGYLDESGTPVTNNGCLAKNTQSITLGIGELLFFAISSNVPDLHFHPPVETVPFIRQIWPARKGLLWPPGVVFTELAADLFATSLSRLVTSLKWKGPTGG